MSSKPTVYLVDDDPLVLKTLESGFISAGFEVRVFTNSETFLASDIQSSDSCLILDLSMPGMSGTELQRQIISRGITLPIIIYSGNADILSTVEAMEQGAITLIQKPANIETLVSRVRQSIALQHKRLEEQVRYKQAADKLRQLSERELAVARLVADGYSAATIADKLYISHRTVEAHKSSIFKKLEIKSVAHLTQLVVLANFLTSTE